MTGDRPEIVVFLDIDGPMIPATMLLANKMASWHRIFPPTTIAVMNEFCRLSGALIVFNTTHNTPINGVADIEVAIVEQGLLAQYLHPTDLKTKYPVASRWIAVNEWLHRHPEVTKWVAFDDVAFTESPNLIVVDPAVGLTIALMDKGLNRLGVAEWRPRIFI